MGKLVKKRAKTGVTSTGKPRKKHVQGKKEERLPKRFNRYDEEIESDDENLGEVPSDEGKPEAAADVSTDDKSSDEEDFFEAPESKRRALARKYLEKIGANLSTDAVAEKLREEAHVASRRVTFTIAEAIAGACRSSLPAGTFYRGHKDTVTCVALPQGVSNPSVAYTGSKDCALIKWDLATGKKSIFAGKFRDVDNGGHFAKVLGVAAVNENVVVSVGEDLMVRVWDPRVTLSKCMHTFAGHTKSVTAVCADVGNDALRKIYTVSADLSLRSWSLATMSNDETFFGHTQTPTGIDILAPQKPVTVGEDGTMRVWKTASESHLMYVQEDRPPADAVVHLSPTHVVMGDEGGGLSLWHTAVKKPVHVVPAAHGVGVSGAANWLTALCGARYSDFLLSGSCDGRIRPWRVAAVEGAEGAKGDAKAARLEPLDFEIAATGFVNGLAISPDNRLVVAALGKEHRFGRWTSLREARNGLLVCRLPEIPAG